MRIDSRTIWGRSRQYFMTVPRDFAEKHREVIIVQVGELLIVVPKQLAGKKSVCELLEEASIRVCESW